MKKISIIAAIMTLLALTGCKQRPLRTVSYDMENTGSHYVVGNLPEFESLPSQHSLPDPLTMLDGRKVDNLDQWEERRAELLQMFQTYEIGPKFQTPKSCVSADFNQEESSIAVTVEVEGETLTFNCPISIPEGKGPFPVIIGAGYNATAGFLPPEVFTSRNIAMIGFPYEDIIKSQQRRGMQPINDLYPEHLEIGSLAGWIWGVSRLIDALEYVAPQLKLDLKRIAITGGSIGGMIALYAGAFDERIALTISQDAGAGGAMSWRVAESVVTATKLSEVDSHWFLKSMKQFGGENVDKLPVDHHELCALIAPRALLVFGSTDYLWQGDEAAYVSCYAARKVWEKFGIEDRIGWSFKSGKSFCELAEDEIVALESFVDKFLLGIDVETNIHNNEDFKYVNCERWL